MRRIVLPSSLQTLNGKPFREQQEDGSFIELSLKEIVQNMLLSAHRLRPLSLEDVGIGVKIWEALKQSDGSVSLEDAEYAWLFQIMNELGPKIWGLNWAVLRQFIERAEQVKA